MATKAKGGAHMSAVKKASSGGPKAKADGNMAALKKDNERVAKIKQAWK